MRPKNSMAPKPQGGAEIKTKTVLGDSFNFLPRQARVLVRRGAISEMLLHLMTFSPPPSPSNTLMCFPVIHGYSKPLRADVI